jgi:leader peptidase (prepilin peptidase)/N-methyltransferase
MGDLKLALLMGAGLGAAVIDALFYGTLASAVCALILLRRHGSEARRMGFPFGPFLAFGAVVALFTGHHLG